MKTFLHLYKEITSLDNLFQAWDEFKKDKRNKKDVGNFERHLEDNIFELHKNLVSKTYKHSAYTGFYVLDPKVRHIHKALVRDRIVHHALFKILNSIFEPTFIADSFSCRENYGTHKGFKKLVKYGRKVSKNYKKICWVLKCDIRKFFDTVDHEILLTLLQMRVKDPDLIGLLKEIIDSYEVEDGKGLPIGNLTSQLFANVYLNPLDQFVKHKLKVKYYIRYTDDFVLLSKDRNYLLELTDQLKNFLNSELKLSLHPNKISLRKLSQGIDFLGYVSLPHHQVLRTGTKRRIFRKIKENILLYKAGDISYITLNQSIQSYFGILKHANAYELGQDLRNKIYFWLNSS